MGSVVLGERVVEKGKVLEAHLDRGLQLLIFCGGHAVVEGTDDPTVARAAFAR